MDDLLAHLAAVDLAGPPLNAASPDDAWKPHVRASLRMNGQLVEFFVRSLPEETRAVLARGPVSKLLVGVTERTNCRVCEATGEMRRDPDSWSWPVMRAVYRLHDWHSGLDLLAFNPFFALSEGPICFERCCVIYRAAGWDG